MAEASRTLSIVAGLLRVKGGGHLHEISLNLTATDFTIDDLGRVVGDTHTIACTTGEGVNGNGGSGSLIFAELTDYLKKPK